MQKYQFSIVFFAAIFLACVLGCESKTQSDSHPAPAKGVQLKKLTLQLEDGTKARYSVQIPKAYSSEQQYPLVLALHYGGEVAPWYGAGFIQVLVGPGLKDLNAFIVAPDSIDGGWASEQNQAAIIAILDQVAADFPIDSERTLVTGFSMGGSGTWETAGLHQERFRAAIPIAGRPPKGSFEWKIPLYVINSIADTVVPIEPTKQYVEEIKAAGADVTFVPVENLSHFSTFQFVTPLKEAIPWIQKIWSRVD